MQRLFLRQSQIKLMDYPEDSFMVYRWFAQVPASLGYDRADSAVPKRREYLKHSHYVRKRRCQNNFPCGSRTDQCSTIFQIPDVNRTLITMKKRGTKTSKL